MAPLRFGNLELDHSCERERRSAKPDVQRSKWRVEQHDFFPDEAQLDYGLACYLHGELHDYAERAVNAVACPALADTRRSVAGPAGDRFDTRPAASIGY